MTYALGQAWLMTAFVVAGAVVAMGAFAVLNVPVTQLPLTD
jgi:hypothetical protein